MNPAVEAAVREALRAQVEAQANVQALEMVGGMLRLQIVEGYGRIHFAIMVMLVCCGALCVLVPIAIWEHHTFVVKYRSVFPRWLRFFDTLRYRHPHNALIGRLALLGWHLYGYILWR
jgi:hypothetical protein